jgi:predicted secreted protein
MMANGEPACALVGDRYEAPDGPPGRGGRHCWEFKAQQNGESVIALAYRRAWGQAATEPQTFQLTVQVTTPEQARSAG